MRNNPWAPRRAHGARGKPDPRGVVRIHTEVVPSHLLDWDFDQIWHFRILFSSFRCKKLVQSFSLYHFFWVMSFDQTKVLCFRYTWFYVPTSWLGIDHHVQKHRRCPQKIPPSDQGRPLSSQTGPMSWFFLALNGFCFFLPQTFSLNQQSMLGIKDQRDAKSWDFNAGETFRGLKIIPKHLDTTTKDPNKKLMLRFNKNIILGWAPKGNQTRFFGLKHFSSFFHFNPCFFEPHQKQLGFCIIFFTKKNYGWVLPTHFSCQFFVQNQFFVLILRGAWWTRPFLKGQWPGYVSFLFFQQKRAKTGSEKRNDCSSWKNALNLWIDRLKKKHPSA